MVSKASEDFPEPDKPVMTTLSKKMIGYALGRTVLASDQPLVREMAAAGGGASFADLAVKIVTSRQFRNRVTNDDAAPASLQGPPTAPPAGGVAILNRPSPITAGTR